MSTAARALASASLGAAGGIAASALLWRRTDSTTRDATTQSVQTNPFCPFGLPSDEHVVVRRGFASSLNYRLRIPNWVAEKYTAEDVDADGVDRKYSRFASDQEVPEVFRASNNDYRGSSLSRGHLAPAGAHKQSQEALDETFLLSDNIVPQEMSNNGSDWLRLERWAKGLCHSPEGGKGSSGDGSFTEVYVISGPLFLPNDPVAPSPNATSKRAGPIRKRVAYDVIGPHEVAVPSHLFKVVLAQRGTDASSRRLSAFVLPNGPVRAHPPLDDFEVSLADVERASGLELFRDLGATRHDGSIPTLCGGKCGLGCRLDGRIEGWKLLGDLKLASNCKELSATWVGIEERSGNLDNMPLIRRVRDERSSKMACEMRVGEVSAAA